MADARGALPTLLGRGIAVKGELHGEGELVVEGRVEGKVTIGRKLVVASGGEVEGEISAGAVSVEGTLTGVVTAAEAIELKPSAVVRGELRTRELSIEDGAVFEGRLEMDVAFPEGV